MQSIHQQTFLLAGNGSEVREVGMDSIDFNSIIQICCGLVSSVQQQQSPCPVVQKLSLLQLFAVYDRVPRHSKSSVEDQ